MLEEYILEGYILNQKQEDIIADLFDNKKLNPAVTELFIRVRKLNISLVFLHNIISLG